MEAPTRANTPLIEYDEKFGLVKINPIAAWTDEDMDAYIDEHTMLVNPLVDEGYPSIGCRSVHRKPRPARIRAAAAGPAGQDRMRVARA